MKINIGFLSSGARLLRELGQGGLVAGLAVLLLAAPGSTFAQDTASSIRGKVLDTTGAVVASASITVEDTRTGVVRGFATNNSGTFLATNLPVGGPYRVTVNGVKSVMIDSISLGETYNLSVNLQTAAELEEIVVVGQSAQFVDVAAGPSTSFSSFDIETAVAFNRDITDVYGLDPRLNIDNEDDGFTVNCGGQHPRFNSVTLDGISYNDRFGLNSNGYATAMGMPFPYEALQQVSVQLAPMDVTYGGFSACNINSVTKSGTNDWDGTLFYEFTTETLRGDSLDGFNQSFRSKDYKQEKKGFSIGGPILEDRLFVFAAYEKAERPRFLARGYNGSGVGEERDWLSQADYQRVVDIATNLWGYDPGGMMGDGVQTDEKYMARLDWNINADHNASLIYNYYEGSQDRDSDGDYDEFEFANHGYTKGAISETLTFKLTSQWNDAFSTEFFYSQSEMNDSQVTVGPKDFGDFQIDLDGDTIYLGADDSRQANKLDTTSDFLKLSGQYLVGDHVITAGYEREVIDIFNIFVQHSRGGEWDFYGFSGANDGTAACDNAATAQERWDNGCGLSGIDQFELGRPSRVYYGSGGGTNDANDAAASFGNTLNTAYLQDEIYLSEHDLTVVAGLRYDWFTSDDSPTYNQAFFDQFGIRNDAGIDGVSLLMPRIGFTWGARDDLTIRGGIGLYSGGNPNVWISNAWSNDGISNAQFSWRNRYPNGVDTVFGPGAIPLTGSMPGYDVPQSLYDDVAAVTAADGNTGFLALIDPDYEQPSQWKLSLGATWDLPWYGITADIDYLHTKQNNPAYYVDISQEVVGFSSAGAPLYDYIDGYPSIDNYMLTNSGNSGKSDMFSMLFTKDFDFGLDVTFGYAYTDATDVSPMTSSVAGSNFDNTSLLDINNPTAATSNYVVPHRLTMRASYGHEFFNDLETRFTVYGVASEGQPQSYVMFSGDQEGDGFYGRHLLYVPEGACAGCADDPNVVYGSGFDTAAFFSFIARNGMQPGFQPRNDIHAKWSTRFDIRISQEIPTFVEGTRGKVFMKMYNFGNFLNDKWGRIEDAQFFAQQVVRGYINDDGQYVYTRFSDRDINYFRQQSSLWEIRMGVDIDF